MDNSIILIDWLTFSSSLEAHELVSLLHLDHLNWTISGGQYGYKYALKSGHISINFDGSSQMISCVNMSGQGCREFEDSSDLSFYDLFKIINSDRALYNITRLDVAFDERDGLFDIQKIAMYINSGWYVSRARYYCVTYSSNGISCEIGSPKSDFRIRIYDKASERGYCAEDGVQWVRVEMQMRDDRASAYIRGIVQGISAGALYVGVLNNYLRFVDPDFSDTNKSRWAVCDWWSDVFDKNVAKIKLYSAPGTLYNTQKLHKFVINQAGSAIKTYCQIMGVDTLLNELVKHDYSVNSNYATLLESYKRRGVDVDRDLLFDQYGYMLDNLPFNDSELDHVFSFNDYSEI